MEIRRLRSVLFVIRKLKQWRRRLGNEYVTKKMNLLSYKLQKIMGGGGRGAGLSTKKNIRARET